VNGHGKGLIFVVQKYDTRLSSETQGLFLCQNKKKLPDEGSFLKRRKKMKN